MPKTSNDRYMRLSPVCFFLPTDKRANARRLRLSASGGPMTDARRLSRDSRQVPRRVPCNGPHVVRVTLTLHRRPDKERCQWHGVDSERGRDITGGQTVKGAATPTGEWRTGCRRILPDSIQVEGRDAVLSVHHLRSDSLLLSWAGLLLSSLDLRY